MNLLFQGDSDQQATSLTGNRVERTVTRDAAKVSPAVGNDKKTGTLAWCWFGKPWTAPYEAEHGWTCARLRLHQDSLVARAG